MQGKHRKFYMPGFEKIAIRTIYTQVSNYRNHITVYFDEEQQYSGPMSKKVDDIITAEVERLTNNGLIEIAE